MARNLSHNMKRLVAGVCALAIVGGAVPVEPIAQMFNSVNLTASATTYDGDVWVSALGGNDILEAGSTLLIPDAYDGMEIYVDERYVGWPGYDDLNERFYYNIDARYIVNYAGEEERDEETYYVIYLETYVETSADVTLASGLTANDDARQLITNVNVSGNDGKKVYLAVCNSQTDTTKSWVYFENETSLASPRLCRTDAGTYYVYKYIGSIAPSETEEGTYVNSVNIDAVAPTANKFTFTAPSDTTYNGYAKSASVTAAQGVYGMGNINVKYYYDEDCTDEAHSPTSVGKYYVGITVEAGSTYAASTDVIHGEDWYFNITKANPTAADFTFTPPANTTYDGNAKAADVSSDKDGIGILTLQYEQKINDSEYESTLTPTEPGTYRVAISTDAATNYKTVNGLTDDSWTFTIALATPALRLSNLSTTETPVKVVERGEVNTELAANADGTYTLEATKKYYIYTDMTIAESSETEDLSMTRNKNVSYGGKTYKYRYSIEVPEIPEFTSYALSHENNWTGVVPNNKRNTLYVADGTVNTNDNTQIAAVMQHSGKLYYGDTLTTDCVNVKAGFTDKVKVEKVYLTKADKTPVTLNSDLPYGTYVITAEVSVDKDFDGFSSNNKDLETTDLICTMYQEVEYSARPMSENKYYLVTKNDQGEDVSTPLNVQYRNNTKDANGNYEYQAEKDETHNVAAVVVPADTLTYNAQAQSPVIVVKNGADETIAVSDTAKDAVMDGTTVVTPAVAKDYDNAVTAKTDAGSYEFALTAVTGDNANYSGSVIVDWSIAKANVNEYITVAPKNNVKTVSTAAANDAIVYDGAVLDSTDFEFKAAEVAEGDTDEVKAKKALAAQLVAEMNSTPASGTTSVLEPKTTVTFKGADKPFSHFTTTNISPTFFIFLPDGYFLANNSVHSLHLNQNNMYHLPGMDDDAYAGARDISFGQTVSQIKIDETGTLKYTLNNQDYSVDLKEGYEWFVERSVDGDNIYYNVSAKSNAPETYDLKSAGNHTAKVTLTNSNFVDVVKSNVGVTIAKRDVTLTPDKDQFMTYRDKEVPAITYSIEDAKADGLTGVVAGDKALFQTITGEGNAAVTTNSGAVIVGGEFSYEEKDGNGDLMNDAGKYPYALKADDKYSNYNIVLPADKEAVAADPTAEPPVEAQAAYTAPQFTVKPMDLSKVDWDWNIELTGEEAAGWHEQGNTGSYTYDGTTKTVDVVQVSKPGLKTAAFNFNGVARPDNSRFVQNDVTVTYTASAVTDSGIVGLQTTNQDDITITIPEGCVSTNISFTATRSYSPFTSITVNDTEERTGAVSAKELMGNPTDTYKITSITVTYRLPDDEYTLAKYDNGEGDYTVGGSLSKASKGTYYVQVKGTGNYTGVAKQSWEIGNAEAVPVDIELENIDYNDGSSLYEKVYDGKEVTGKVVFDEDADSSSVDDYVDNAESEIKVDFYKQSDWDDTSKAPRNNAEPLDGAPKNFGDYYAVVTIKSEGYEDQVVTKKFSIYTKDLSMKEGTPVKTWTYGDDIPKPTEADVDNIVGLTDDDAALLKQYIREGKIRFVETQDKSNLTLGPSFNSSQSLDEILAFMEEFWTYRENYNTDKVVWSYKINPKSLKSQDISVTYDNKVVLNDNGFVYPTNIEVYDGSTKLTEGTDYTINVDTAGAPTSEEITYVIEIIGKGNYKNILTVYYTANTAEMAAQEAIIAATTLELSEPKPTVNSSGVGRVTVTATRGVPEDSGLTIKETGFIYVKDASNTDALTLENANDANCVVTKILAGTTNGSKTAHFTDPEGKGVRVVAFAVVSDGTYETTIYTDEVKTTYTELKTAADEKAIADAKKAIAEATTLELSEPKPTVNSSGVGRVTVTATRGVPEDSGLTIVETGMIYVKDASNTDVLTLENANDENCAVTKILAGTTNGSKTAHFTDPEGKGARVVAYAVVSDGTYETTVYTDEVNATFAGLAEEADAMVNIEEATTLTLSAPKATVNASGVGRVTVTASRAVEEGYTIEETGFIYVKDTSVETALTLENVGKDGIAKNLAGTTNGGKTAHFTDPDDKGVRVVAYAIVTDGTYSKTFYTDEVSAKYSELSAMS